jgi:hypothetical protein
MSAPAQRQLSTPEHTSVCRVRPSVIRFIALLVTARTRDSVNVHLADVQITYSNCTVATVHIVGCVH